MEWNLLVIVILIMQIVPTNGESCSASTPTVKVVEDCPKTAEKWADAAAKKKCHRMEHHNCKSFEYHCLMDQHENTFIEVCAPTWFMSGFCAMFNTDEERVIDNFDLDCTKFPDGAKCPSRFISTDAYRYQQCYEHVRNKTGSNHTQIHITSNYNERKYQELHTCESNISLIVSVIVLAILLAIVSIIMFVLIILPIIRKTGRDTTLPEEKALLPEGETSHGHYRNDPDVEKGKREKEIQGLEKAKSVTSSNAKQLDKGNSSPPTHSGEASTTCRPSSGELRNGEISQVHFRNAHENEIKCREGEKKELIKGKLVSNAIAQTSRTYPIRDHVSTCDPAIYNEENTESNKAETESREENGEGNADNSNTFGDEDTLAGGKGSSEETNTKDLQSEEESGIRNITPTVNKDDIESHLTEDNKKRDGGNQDLKRRKRNPEIIQEEEDKPSDSRENTENESNNVHKAEQEYRENDTSTKDNDTQIADKKSTENESRDEYKQSPEMKEESAKSVQNNDGLTTSGENLGQANEYAPEGHDNEDSAEANGGIVAKRRAMFGGGKNCTK